ncbi:MAG TPA: ABC transporter ATP-binding protein [Symbiobacteriaceae bacterium]|nr:ABC transporter ATP-binding protein [Symbiobacteriaceae bacterium]
MNPPLVEVVNVVRAFGEAEVLRGVSLATQPGEVVAIYGRSGSGKTTLLNIVGGLDRPTAGVVRLSGTDLTALPEAKLDEARRTQMAFVFQSYGLLPHLTARDNVEFALRLAGCPPHLWRDRVDESLEEVGLTRRARHRPPELSGGERQRVALARALAVRPRLLLADEPTGALDHATGVQMINLLVRFARETGAGIWIVTHDRSVRERVDRAYQISEGRLAPAGEVAS